MDEALGQSVREYDLEALRRLVEDDPGAPEFPALAEALRRAGDAEAALAVSETGLEHAPARLAGRVSLGLALLDLGRRDEARDALSEILDAVLEPHRLQGIESALDVAAEDDRSSFEGAQTGGPAVAGGESDSGIVISDYRPAELDAPRPLATVDVGWIPQPAAGASADAFEEQLADDEIEEAFEAAEAQPDEMISANTMAEQALLDHAPSDEAVGEDAHPDACLDEEIPAYERDDEESGFELEEVRAFRTATMAGLLEAQGDRDRADRIRAEIEEQPAAEVECSAAIGESEGAEEAARAEEGLAALERMPIPDMDVEVGGGAVVEDAAEAPPLGIMDAAEAPPRAAISAGHDPEAERRSRIVATLERWLHNLQRGA